MMNISKEAKELLLKNMKEHDCNCMRITVEPSGCCGSSLNFTLDKLVDGDQQVKINDLAIVMDEQAQNQTASLTINAENGELVVDGGDHGCGCGSSGCC
jgi:Fe-S cluster assembly iron-binding protein IscA